MVQPRHVAEALHLLEIEVGAEEAGKGNILCAGGLIRAVVNVLDESVDAAKHAVGPAAAGCRHLT